MSFEAFRSWLGAGPALSLIALLLVAALAAMFSARQLSSFKTFELLRYIESEHHIEALSIVATEIRPLRSSQWWLVDGHQRLVDAATEVASTYDVLHGLVCRLDHETRSIFYSNWADAIVRTHEALESYIAYRRREATSPSVYGGFSELAAAVRSYAVGVS